MNKLFPLLLLTFLACQSISQISKTKKNIPFYVWTRGFHNPSTEELQRTFSELKHKGIDGIIYSAGEQAVRYEKAAKIAKANNLKFYALIPALIRAPRTGLEKSAYVVNGLGESAYNQPAYPRNHFVCPNRPEVYEYLVAMYRKIALIPEVDGIQLDVIRFPDVILAPALWEKYGLKMDKEYPKYDYCYCNKCVKDFAVISGINIKTVADPAQILEWKQFRYEVLTKLVNRLAAIVHQENKEINAAVFPGPHSVAKKLVRQEWNKWELDAFFPMNYNDFYLEGPHWIGKVCKEAVKSLPSPKPVFSGLFICPNPANKVKETDPENFGLLPAALETAIDASIKNGASGICLFTAGRMTEAHWAVVEQYLK